MPPGSVVDWRAPGKKRRWILVRLVFPQCWTTLTRATITANGFIGSSVGSGRPVQFRPFRRRAPRGIGRKAALCPELVRVLRPRQLEDSTEPHHHLRASLFLVLATMGDQWLA